MVWLLVVLNWWKYRKFTTEKGKQMAFCKLLLFGFEIFLVLMIYVDVNFCLWGCIIWTVILAVWIVAFQMNWKKVPFFQYFQMAIPEGMGWQ